MKLSTLISYFKFSKSQRAGLVALFGIIIVFQCVYFFIDFDSGTKPNHSKQQWINLPVPKDTLNRKSNTYKRRPFNPNYITDFKGYQLGMSVAEIDRLLAYRKTNRYVNSADEFQKVTQVSDSLLKAIAPYFKFPDWVNKKNATRVYATAGFVKKEPNVIKDINLASAEDLKKVYGIGDGLSERILKEKERLGGFVSMKQMQDIWGLSPEVIDRLNKDFKITTSPTIKKVRINQATVKELMLFPYFKYPIAKAIITFRSMNGGIKNYADLSKISEFPVDKIEIIALYLEF